MKSLTQILTENSLYKDATEKATLVADPSHIATAFLFNFIGFLGLINRTDSPKVFAYLKKDKQLRMSSIGDENNDISLVLKLAFDERFFINTTVPNDIAKFLFLLKSGKITHVNDDIVHVWLDALTPKFVQSLDSKLRSIYLEFRDSTDRKTLGWIVDALKRQANKYETSGAGEFREIVKTISLNRSVAKPKVIPGATPVTPQSVNAVATATAVVASPSPTPVVEPEPSFPSIADYKAYLASPNSEKARQLGDLYIAQRNWKRVADSRNIAVRQVFIDNLDLLGMVSNIATPGTISFDEWQIDSAITDDSMWTNVTSTRQFFQMLTELVVEGIPSQHLRQLIAYLAQWPKLIPGSYATIVAYIGMIQMDFKKECQQNRMGKNIFAKLVSFIRNGNYITQVKITPEKFAEAKNFFIDQTNKSSTLIAQGVPSARELFGMLFEEPGLDSALIKQTMDSFPSDAEYIEFIRKPSNAEIARFEGIRVEINKQIQIYPKLDTEQGMEEKRNVLGCFAGIYRAVGGTGDSLLIHINSFSSSRFENLQFKKIFIDTLNSDIDNLTLPERQAIMFMAGWGADSTAAPIVFRYIAYFQENCLSEFKLISDAMGTLRGFDNIVYRFYSMVTNFSTKIKAADVTEAVSDEALEIVETHSYLPDIYNALFATTKFTKEIHRHARGNDIQFVSATGNGYWARNPNLREAFAKGFSDVDFDRQKCLTDTVDYFVNKYAQDPVAFYYTLQKFINQMSKLWSPYYHTVGSKDFFLQFSADVIGAIITKCRPGPVDHFEPGDRVSTQPDDNLKASLKFLCSMFLYSSQEYNVIGFVNSTKMAGGSSHVDYVSEIAKKSPVFVKVFGHVIKEIETLKGYKSSNDPDLSLLLKYVPDPPNLREHFIKSAAFCDLIGASAAEKAEMHVKLITRALEVKAIYTTLSINDIDGLINYVNVGELSPDSKKRMLAFFKNKGFLAGIKLYKDDKFKGSGSIQRRNEYVSMITALIMDLVKTDPLLVNGFFDHIDDRYVENKIGNNLIGKDHISNIIQKGEIKPFTTLNEQAMRQILAFNDINYAQVIADMGIDVKRARKEPLATYLIRIADAIEHKNSGKGFAAVKVVDRNLDKKALAQEAIELTKTHTGGTHGSIYMKILKAFDVHIDSKEFDDYLEVAKTAGVDATIQPAFHGTGGIAACMILRYGWKVSAATSGSIGGVAFTGKMLGPGIYFSNKLDKALQYVGNDGFGRKEGTRGYVFSTKPTLGPMELSRDASKIGYEARGINGRDGIRSPEWVVRDARKQLKILHAYEVVIVDKHDYDTYIRTTLNEDTRMTFGQFLKEDEDLSDTTQQISGGGIQFVFYDGKIPVMTEDGLRVLEYLETANYDLPPGVRHEATAKGASLIFPSHLNERIDVRFAAQMDDATRKRFESLMAGSRNK